MVEGVPAKYLSSAEGRTQGSKRKSRRSRPVEAKVYVLREENRFQLDPSFVAEYVDKQPPWGFGILSRITYERTYARPVTKALLAKQAVLYRGMDAESAKFYAEQSPQKHEAYWQTVLRAVEGVSSILKQQVRDTGQPWSDDEEQHHAKEMFRRMWAFKFTPPGRGLWFMGTEAMEIKGSAALNNCFVGREQLITREHGAVRFDAVVGQDVTVLTPEGWRSAVVQSFGEQVVQDVTFAPADMSTRNGAPRKSRSNLRVTLRVTPDHRWLTLNRGEVTDLQVGDFVASHVNQDRDETSDYCAGRRHGLIFGDGTAGYQHTSFDTRVYHIRLCGDKAREEVTRFEHVTYPPSYHGDPYCHVTSDRDLKGFPEGVTPDYLRGFLDGWIVADGSVKPNAETFRLASQHPGAEAWLRAHAASAGWLLTGIAVDKALTTNFGARSQPLTAYSLTRQPRAWVVTQVDALDDPEPVYCAQVPDTRSFVLGAGIHTGNCGFVSTEHIDIDFSEPFCTLMDYSMLGVGMGFDLRGAGAVTLSAPATSLDAHVVADTREGWIECVRIVLDAFVGKGPLPSAWDTSRVRKEGTPLKTFGGTASGPKPLEQLLASLTSMLYAVVGAPISGKTITSIMNMIGKCVVAGNVRRSSEIALGDPDDTDFIKLKDPTELIELRTAQADIAKAKPEWRDLDTRISKLRQKRRDAKLSVLDAAYGAFQAKIDRLEKKQKAILETDAEWLALNDKINAHPLMSYLWASNNTALCRLGTKYDTLAESTIMNGEPGYGWMDVIRAYGRLADPPNWKDKNAKGFNPCVPAGTRILTREGYLPIDTLVGTTVSVWNGTAWAPVVPKVTGHDQPLVRVSLSDGTSLVCTEYHKWHLAPRNYACGEAEVVRAIDLQPGDTLAKYGMPVVEYGTDWELAYTHGFFCGDGQVSVSGTRGALLYGAKKALLPQLVGARPGAEDAHDRQYVGLPASLPDKFIVRHDLSLASRLAWFAGLLDADGCVLRNPNSVCLQLSSVNQAFLLEVRLLLTTLGVQAKVTVARDAAVRLLPDGKGGHADYACQTNYRLLVNAMDTYRLVNLGLRTHRLELPQQRPQRDARRFVTVDAVEKVGVAGVVYCFEEPLTHRGTFEGVVTGQCGEQTLFDKELCCLVETYPTRHDSLEDFLITLKYAYRYAKAVTLVPTHNKATNAVMVRNRRIGTSMAGIIEQYSKLGLQECIRWWDTGYREIRKWDVEYSSWLGVNESIKSTSIKPGGTTPLLAGVEGGMKAPTSRFYMRTIRFDYRSPLVAQLASAGYRVEKDRTTPRTMVVYFPCETKPGVLTASELGLWEQAQIFTALQKYWSDNMVSATLTFQAHEAKTLPRLLTAFEGQWKCVSFLPLFEHAFLQAPYIECTQEEYEEARAKLKSVGDLIIEHDTDDKWCSGGICELPVAS